MSPQGRTDCAGVGLVTWPSGSLSLLFCEMGTGMTISQRTGKRAYSWRLRTGSQARLPGPQGHRLSERDPSPALPTLQTSWEAWRSPGVSYLGTSVLCHGATSLAGQDLGSRLVFPTSFCRPGNSGGTSCTVPPPALLHLE